MPELPQGHWDLNWKKSRTGSAAVEFIPWVLMKLLQNFLPSVLSMRPKKKARIGFDKIKEKVVNPLKGKKIGAYYGCLLLRPGKILEFDNPENPSIMEDFIRAIGGEPVVYPYRNECCGGYISLKEKDMSENMCNKIVDSAAGFGADFLITACPLCMYNLNKNTVGDLPVYYFTELLAEALGVKDEVNEEVAK